MPREIAFHGLYMPTMTLMFLIAAGLAWALDRFLAGFDLYRFFLAPGVAAPEPVRLPVRRPGADRLPLRMPR